MKKTVAGRFMDKVKFTKTCWIWTGATNKYGYGQFVDKHVLRLAHRYSYELFVGDLEDDMQIDHLRFVRECVNPNHLEQVTQQENMQRAVDRCVRERAGFKSKGIKRSCLQGHLYTTENTIYIMGIPSCKKCYIAR